MLYIDCPNCGKRHELEFTYGGQNVKRMTEFDHIDHEELGAYLFIRSNPKGEHKELWYHSAGCRKWFYVIRDTATNRIIATHQIDNNEGENE